MGQYAAGVDQSVSGGGPSRVYRLGAESAREESVYERGDQGEEDAGWLAVVCRPVVNNRFGLRSIYLDNNVIR